ncbi:MAG TPA: N4-gp56 family major capsid protein [Bacillota bacterium]|nr:N4-gp56 family major capsid protein [Bacillota bacterium]
MNKIFKSGIIPFNIYLFDEVINNLNSPGLVAEVDKVWWDTKLIHMAKKKLYYTQFGDPYPIPPNNGRTVEMRIMRPSAPALTPLTDGDIPDGELIDVDKITATVKQYGTYKKITDMVEWTSCDRLTSAIHEENGRQAFLTLDILAREELVGGTNVYYAPQVSSGSETAVTSRADLNKNCKLTPNLLFNVQAILRANDAEPFEGDAYVGIIHPQAALDIKKDKDYFIDVVKYAAGERIFAGEIGKYAGIRFVESSNAKIFYPNDIVKGKCRFTVKTAAAANATVITVKEAISDAEAATFPVGGVDVYINGVAYKVTGVTAGAAGSAKLTVTALTDTVPADALVCGQGAGKDGSAVFGTVILARHAYGTIELENGGLEFIAKSRKEAGGPLEQFSTAGWKATFAAKRLQEDYMIRIESANEFSATLKAPY